MSELVVIGFVRCSGKVIITEGSEISSVTAGGVNDRDSKDQS